MASQVSKAEMVALQMESAQVLRNRLLATPSLFIITIFGVVPLLIILVYSFLKAASFGGVEWQFSTAAYLNFLFQKDSLDLGVYAYLHLACRCQKHP